MICTLCHGNKTYFTKYTKKRITCPACGGSGEMSDKYPTGDHNNVGLGLAFNENRAYKPFYHGQDPRQTSDLDALFDPVFDEVWYE